MKKITALSILTIMITSCAANPTVVEVQQASDLKLNCEQLASQISEAQSYKVAAREDDNFKAKYIWLPTGVISAYRFNKAEGNAQDRVEYLNSLTSKKGCSAPRQSKIMYDSIKQKQFKQPGFDMKIPSPAPETPVPFGN